MNAQGDFRNRDASIEVSVQVKVVLRNLGEFLVEFHHDREGLVDDFFIVVDALVFADRVASGRWRVQIQHVREKMPRVIVVDGRTIALESVRSVLLEERGHARAAGLANVQDGDKRVSVRRSVRAGRGA